MVEAVTYDIKNINFKYLMRLNLIRLKLYCKFVYTYNRKIWKLLKKNNKIKLPTKLYWSI
jgi:hypothetical protein